MVLSSKSCGVTPGKKAIDTLSFDRSRLEECGIGTIGTVEISFEVNDRNTLNAFFETGITIETTDAKRVTQGAIKTKRVLFEQDGIWISFIGFDRDSSDLKIKLFIENNSDRSIKVQSGDTSINGLAVRGSMYCNVKPGKKAIYTLSFYSSSLKENNITEIESLELKFMIYDRDSYGVIAETSEITIQGNE